MLLMPDKRKEEGKGKPSSIVRVFAGRKSVFISLGRRELRGRAGAGARTLCGWGSLLI